MLEVSPLGFKDHVRALVLFALATAVYTYPLVLAPARLNRLDSPDALLNGWTLSYVLGRIFSDPFRLFEANIFFPEENALALSENLLTGALLVSPVSFLSSSPLLLLNAALLLGFLGTAYAAFLLAWDVTGDRLASGLAGILFAFAPFRFAHLPHVQLQLAFGIPLMLLFARRILRGAAGAGPLLGLAIAFPLTFGSSVYYAVYGATVLPLFALLSVEAEPRSRLLRVGAAALLGGLATLPLALPYWSKMGSGMERSLDIASGFSASGLDYFSSFSHLHAFLPKTPEPLFPGAAALGLAAFGLVRSSSDRRGSVAWFGIGALGVALSLGPSFGLFSALYELLPPYRALRVPSRAGVLFLLAVAVLAARGLSRIPKVPVRLALAVLAAAECFSGPLPFVADPPALPPIYERLKAQRADGALLELPFPPSERFQENAIYVYRSAFHGRRLVNGYSGFVPETYRRTHRGLMENPLAKNLEGLSAEGVRFLLVHEARIGPRWRREIAEAVEKGLLSLVGDESPDRLYEIRIED